MADIDDPSMLPADDALRDEDLDGVAGGLKTSFRAPPRVSVRAPAAQVAQPLPEPAKPKPSTKIKGRLVD